METLHEKRTEGIYKDNIDGFVDEFMELSQNITYDTSKPFKATSFFGEPDISDYKDGLIEEAYHDRHLMASELC